MRTNKSKFKTIIDKNTFYFSDRHFEEKYEGYLNSLKETMLVLKNEIYANGLKKSILIRLLAEKENGLTVLMTLTGFSNESFKRLITVIRVAKDRKLNQLMNKKQWCKDEEQGRIKEWSNEYISKMIKENSSFRRGIVNLFFEGATIPFLANNLPLFELKKLSIEKLKFDTNSLIDTLIRYKEKGSYKGIKENNPENLIANILGEIDLPFEKGDLNELVAGEFNMKRMVDFIIPSKVDPKVVAESSFMVTTSSGQGDKSKAVISNRQILRRYYPRIVYIGFIDGIGWYVRQNDLMRIVSAYDDVFTFRDDEIKRFKKFILEAIE